MLVKGGNYTEDEVVGADIVRGRGGSVRVLAEEGGVSTAELIGRVKGASDGSLPK